MRRCIARLFCMFRSGTAESELAREVDSHLKLIQEDFERRGLSPNEAKLAALRAYGGVELAKELHREARSFLWIEQFFRDLHYGGRMLARDLGFTAAAVITLALGIGINTSIFSLISDRLLKPLPYKDADRIVMVHETPLNNPREWSGAAVPNFVAWRDLNRVFEHIGTVNDASLSTNEEEPERLIGLRVQYGYLEALGAKPLLGRLISPTDCVLGNGEVVVLSHKLWLRRYGADSRVLGKIIPAGLRNFTIIGVLPADFQSFAFGAVAPEVEFWIPYEFTKTHMQTATRYLGVTALLKPGVSLEQAQAEMTRITANLAQENPKRNEGWGVTVVPIREVAIVNVRNGLF